MADDVARHEGVEEARRAGAVWDPQLMRAAALVMLALWMPLNVETRLVDYGANPDMQHRVSLFLFDLPLGAILLLQASRLASCLRHKKLDVLGWITFGVAALLLLSLFVHPSARGVQALLRFAGTIAVATSIADLTQPFLRSVALGSFVGSAAGQSLLGVIQVARRGTLGLTGLGEHPPLLEFGNEVAAKGTFVHPYIMAGFAILAAAVAWAGAPGNERRPGWLVAGAAALVSAAITFSRMSVVSVGGMALVLAVGWVMTRRREVAATALALVVGFGVPAAFVLDGWARRVDQTVTGAGGAGEPGADAITSARITFVRQSWNLLEDAPFVGVGPGLYAISLDRALDLPPRVEIFTVHNVVLLVATESGIPAAIGIVAIAVILARRAWRGGPLRLMLYWSLVPFFMLDHFLYSTPQGLVMSGVWAGLLLLPEASDSA